MNLVSGSNWNSKRHNFLLQTFIPTLFSSMNLKKKTFYRKTLPKSKNSSTHKSFFINNPHLLSILHFVPTDYITFHSSRFRKGREDDPPTTAPLTGLVV